ncbi:2-oxo acid dehydrogenase subunit E2 [Bacillus velezensis]|uniref:Dihydrolipoamide acetyltransferase component of pyruvate dehydrogenase complex n=1 Tax=Bacillus velezensis (strain DSM 23117 / BGSC 10A6 / LMG 26770 / FZB42) TaxID=326423 RepID=A7Z6G6_BACVZ|nr:MULTISPECIES: dihydrolipoamide acetyltransferase family protein [Bacillus amyloliquefaciens group]ABS74592.1 2-oxo acid dehydrogenase subunit E2 [Bacillus velezensis FZB42]AGZ57004.1 branched-chain alpha-keto acid dehydrogenase subunit E2 [Bacillus amyloliquefaciens CC178]AZJ43898.1 2-oxo acid dehydrogenase subunit E2 [Bacillus velezensis]MBG9701783.1 branched-chain alpha-keto acid dehydrogenase subunit E2 [Bacillus amyloliquefaciens]MBT9271129.1 2-oxo acid dehydrogenase subunit E2 [Bacillu
MAIEQMAMPQLGESVTEGTISKWLVSPGDQVNKYDPIAEVMTDKVNAEVPSSFTGTIRELVGEEGQTLAVGEIICKIETEETETEEAPKREEEQNSPSDTDANRQGKDQSNKARYSPAVLRLAGEHGIQLEEVEGTGAGGRITRKDIQKIIDSGMKQKSEAPAPAAVQTTQQAPKQQQEQAPAPALSAGDIEIPVTGVRKAIAANMHKSKTEIPHAWTMMEVDVTNMTAYRNSIKDSFKQKEGFNLTFFAFFVKAAAQALKEFPQMNSMWAGDKIVQKKDINISIAVATEDSLFVPVIKHADEKTIKGIAREITDLAKKVRNGKLTAEDMQGGTFTVNNTGSFGSVQSMGIINHPQAAILQVESIVKRPVVMNNGMIAVRDMVNLCLSLDHRVLDGLVCGRFLGRVKEILENIDEHTSVY